MYLFVQAGTPSAYSGRPAKTNNAGMVELDDSDQHALAAQAAEWRRRALRGDRTARGIAHSLEVKVRKLGGAAPPLSPELDTRPLAPWLPSRQWWKPWRRN
jgi:hypothetical protein